jgi:hypothetical protein
MQSTLTINSPVLKTGINPTAIAAAVYTSAAELEADIKTNIQQSVPAGRTYRRTAIVRKNTRRTSGLIGLRRRGDRVIVGYNFHRASRAGQPPAILHGRLINSIRALRVGPFAARVICGVSYGLPLDDPAYLNRPFFMSRAQLYRERFVANIRAAAFG